MVADYDRGRAEATVAAGASRTRVTSVRGGPGRCLGPESVAALVREHRATHVMNAVDPRFVMPIFDGAFAAGADYLDMAMSLSQPDPERPYGKTGVKLGDEQFAVGGRVGAGRAARARRHGRRARAVGRVRPLRRRPPVLRDRRVGIRDGANLTVEGYDFAPSFSIWTTIEECLNPPVIWEADRGWSRTPPFSEPEVFDFPAASGRSSA